MRHDADGFTLVEMIIVVVVLMIITAIAVPHYLSALQRGHEAYAVSTLRAVQTGEEGYRLQFHEYAGSFSLLDAYASVEVNPDEFPAFDSAPVAYAAPLPAFSFQGHSGTSPGHGGTPPGQGGTPPGQGGTPPGQGGTPPSQGGTPPGQGGTPPGQGGTPPGQGGTPPGQGGTPPGQGGTPPGQTGGAAGGGGTTPATTYPLTDTMVKSLYIFQLTQTDADHWQCTAQPVRDRLTSRFFYIDDTGVIRATTGALANASSPTL